MSLRIPILSFLLIALALPSVAQRTLHGTISTTQGEALWGATVKVKEHPTLGAVSDRHGHYTITLPDTSAYTLEVSMMGMASQARSTTEAERGKLDFKLKEERRTLETVVVTATRTPKLLKDVPIVTRVIAEQEIKDLDLTGIQDLLQTELPGIEFTYSMNQQVSLNMQGFGGNSVLFLVDGERLAGETLDNIDYSRLGLEDAGRVEIVKGAASSLYGSNAVGGVVNIISRHDDAPWSLNLNTRYGSHRDLRYGANLGLHHKWLSSQTNVQATSCDPIKMPNSGDFSTIYGNRTLNAKQRFVLTPVEQLRLTLRGGYFFRERQSSQPSYDRYRDFAGGAKADYTIDSVNDLSLAYAFDQYDKSDYAVGSGLDVRNYSNVQHTLRGIFNHTFLHNGTLTAGGDFMRDYLMSYQFAATNRAYTQYTADAFAQWDFSPQRWLNIVVAARYDYYSEATASHFSPKVNLMFKLPKSWSIRASYANGFRAPTLKEMHMNFDMANIFMIYGNPDLKPEVSHNFNATFAYDQPTYSLTAMPFFNRVSQRITTLWNQARGGMVYENMTPTSISGIDLSASVRWECGLGARLSAVYTHESLSEGGLRTSSTRPLTATARLDYTHHSRSWRYNIGISGRALSAVTVDEYTKLTDPSQTEEQRYPAYTLWKLNASLRYFRGITCTLTIDNIFNYRPSYYYSNSPATTGTTIALGGSIDIDQLFR
ncbi:MAG: TonB-dependent receptor [Bacteroidales bacterium]|nr:TonB-dependent receptor [Bacteroidales bacterium]